MSTSSYGAIDASELETKRVVANRANARHSTGPTTEAGKAISSRNAIVTGLTGRTVVLASDDVTEYALHLSRHHAEYLPITDAESELVQTIADCEWRLLRILTIESGVYALGEREFGDLFPEERREVRNALIKAQTLLTHQRTLNNLSIQESRLERQKSKAIVALEALKKIRPQTPVAVHARKPVSNSPSTLAASANGFEFSDSTESVAQPASAPPASKFDIDFRAITLQPRR